MLGNALTASLDDLALGVLLAVVTLALIIGPLIYLEWRYGAEEDGLVEEPRPADPWAGLPPKWSPPRAESGDVSERRAA